MSERLMLPLAYRLARALPHRLVVLDYPVHQRSRWGWGRPAHTELQQILESRRPAFQELLDSMLPYAADFARLGDPVDPAVAGGSPLRTPWLPGLDALVLYAQIRSLAPTRYIEVGSGVSTVVARHAVHDGELPTRIISIDPEPRAAIDLVCDEVVRQPLEDVDLGVFDQLGAGDVLFVDNSHRSLMNSDVTVFFLEILPRLAPGVVVQLHDIFLPYDYPPGWAGRGYSEQYLLAAILLSGAASVEPRFASQFVVRDDTFRSSLETLWSHKKLNGVSRDGGSFWLTVLDGNRPVRFKPAMERTADL